MPSTYSTSLGLELIGNGEQAGTWGTTTNTNLGTLLEQAIAGVQSITLPGGDYTLTDFNGLPDEARNAVLVFGGLLGAPCNVIAPAVEKVYIVRNFSNATVTVKTSGGNGVAIANAASEVIFCDGTNIFSATQFNFIDGNLTVTGTATANNLVATNNITLGKDLFGNASTGQIYVPVGTEAQRTASPINGVIRYNTDLQAYEGYANSNWVTFNVSRQGVYSIGYFFVAGGGGGGVGGIGAAVMLSAGGGGAGGFLSSAVSGLANITPGVTYTVVVGAGGAGGGTNGSNTAALGLVAIGGGGGGTLNSQVGKSGGSGGGGGSQAGGTGGSGFPGQGNDGASNSGSSGGGGGGASGAGGAAFAGGPGTSTSITGTSVSYAGGGGGAGYDGSSGGAGGSGGGGAGGTSVGSRNGVSGTIYTGGGGGGGSTIQGDNGAGAGSGGSGGSGVAILSIPTTRYSGNTTGSPLVSTFGNATILTFLASGSYTA
jgi:hypothetical protein